MSAHVEVVVNDVRDSHGRTRHDHLDDRTHRRYDHRSTCGVDWLVQDLLV